MEKRRSIRVIFWGTRGSIPVSGRRTLRFGGNTACVEIQNGQDSLILDGGSGIRLIRPTLRKGKGITVLISHTHTDHLLGLPFFPPALKKGQKIRIFGPPGLKRSLRRLFPFPILRSKRDVVEIRPGPFRIPPFEIDCHWLNHPGKTLGYRVETSGGKAIVYMSDHESNGDEGEIAQWMRRPDLLILDSQYRDRDYHSHRGWGHLKISDAVRLALKGGAKHLILFHHDPNHSDVELMKKWREARLLTARSGSKMRVTIARDGLKVQLVR